MSGLSINYSKNELIPLNLSDNEGNHLAEILECKIGSLPIKYLGVQFHWKKLRNRDWDFLVNKIDKKLSNWKGKLLSIGGRLTLIKVVLNAIPIYWMSKFRLPINITKKIDQLCRRFL
jgi:hypothetical protein